MLTLIAHPQWQASHKQLNWAHSPARCLYMAWNNKALCAMGYTKNAHEAHAHIQKAWKAATLTQHDNLPPAYLHAIQKNAPPTMQALATEFQASVWIALLTIPYGETRTYQQLAQQIGKPNAARATGNAIARNPIAQFIPCHRIIPANGGTGNYAWGAQHKTRLLQIEKHSTLAA